MRKTGKGREEDPLGQALGCDHTPANCLQTMHDQASRPGCPSPSGTPCTTSSKETPVDEREGVGASFTINFNFPDFIF